MLAVRATVRPARREDSPAAAAVVRAVYEEFGFAWEPDGYHADLADVETMMAVAFVLFVAAAIANGILLWIDHRLHKRV